MARGQKYSDEDKEKAYALCLDGETASNISKRLKIPESTIRTWLKNKPPDEFDEFREEKKRARTRAFIEQADGIIRNGMNILASRFERALKKEAELDELLSAVSEDEDMSPKQKEALIRKLKELQLSDVRSLTIAVATLYDKRELAEGQTEAQESGGVIILPEVKIKEE